MHSSIIGVGDKANDFTLESTNGRYNLYDRLKNKRQLLYFYVVNYGKTCTDYMELMNERFDELAELNIELVHINPETVENHKEWIKHTSSLYEHLSDKDQVISKEFDCIITKCDNEKVLGKTNRAFFLIDYDGEILYAWRAPIPHNTVPMSELIANMRKTILNKNNQGL